MLGINLAVELSRRGRDCLLVDLDPWGGDVGTYLEPESVDPRRGLLPLLKLEHEAISEDAVARECQRVGDHLLVLLGFIRPEPDLLRGRIDDLLRSAMGMAQVTVVDLGRMVADSPCLEAFSACDQVLLTVRPDLQGALAAERALALLPEAPDVVASNVRRRGGADVIELSEALGRQVKASIPHLRSPLPRRRARLLRRELSRVIDALPPSAKTDDLRRRAAQKVAVA